MQIFDLVIQNLVNALSYNMGVTLYLIARMWFMAQYVTGDKAKEIAAKYLFIWKALKFN